MGAPDIHSSIMMYNRFPGGGYLLEAPSAAPVLRTYITYPYSASECVVPGPCGEVVRILTVLLCLTR